MTAARLPRRSRCVAAWRRGGATCQGLSRLLFRPADRARRAAQQATRCLFSDEVLASPAAALQRATDAYGFDFARLRQVCQAARALARAAASTLTSARRTPCSGAQARLLRLHQGDQLRAQTGVHAFLCTLRRFAVAASASPRPCTLQVAATRAANASALDDANARKQVRGRFARCALAAVVALAVSRAPAVRRSAARSDIGGAGALRVHHLAAI